MNPEQLLAAMIEVYAHAETYRDTGRIVKQVRYQGRLGQPFVREFCMAFRAPDRFRLESHLPEYANFGHAIAWGDGADLRLWRQRTEGLLTDAGVTTRESLDFRHWLDRTEGFQRPRDVYFASLHVLTLEGRTAIEVHGLLFPGVRYGRWFRDLVDVVTLPGEALDGVMCYRLQGRCGWWDAEPTPDERDQIAECFGEEEVRNPTRHEPLTIWIDCRTLLVRRIETRTIAAGRLSDIVTTFQPEVGVPVSEAELAFEPPEAVG